MNKQQGERERKKGVEAKTVIRDELGKCKSYREKYGV